MNKLVSGAMGVEIKIAPNQNRVQLPDIAELRGKRIKHIDICNIPKTPSGHNNISNLSYGNIFLTLVELNTQTELIRALPLELLNPEKERLFINKIVSFNHSYIDVSALGASETNRFLYFVFWYDEPAIWNIVPNKNNRTEIHPVEITLTGKKTYFSEDRDLLNKQIQNIILSLPGYTPTGKNGISSAKDKFLTLRNGTREFISRVPLYLFKQQDFPFQLRLQNITFDFQTSYIDALSDAQDDLGTVFFNFIVDDNKKKR